LGRDFLPDIAAGVNPLGGAMASGIGKWKFIAAFGGAAVAWPLAARAQQPALPVVGFLCSASAESFPDYLKAIREGLSESGFIEGRNVAIEYSFADSQLDDPCAT
jgi:putative ABC transport system substrate-binding protein